MFVQPTSIASDLWSLVNNQVKQPGVSLERMSPYYSGYTLQLGLTSHIINSPSQLFVNLLLKVVGDVSKVDSPLSIGLILETRVIGVQVFPVHEDVV